MNKYTLDHPDDHQLTVRYHFFRFDGTCIECQNCGRKWHTKYDWVAPWLRAIVVLWPDYESALIPLLLPTLTSRHLGHILALIIGGLIAIPAAGLFHLLLFLLLRRAKSLSDHCGKPY